MAIKYNKDNIKYIYYRASKRLKLFRKYRKVSQQKLSDESLFSRGFIANIESEKVDQTFSLAFLYYVSQKLNIPIELFIKENIDKEIKELGITEEEYKSYKDI